MDGQHSFINMICLRHLVEKPLIYTFEAVIHKIIPSLLATFNKYVGFVCYGLHGGGGGHYRGDTWCKIKHTTLLTVYSQLTITVSVDEINSTRLTLAVNVIWSEYSKCRML